jgi:hypothetical protein
MRCLEKAPADRFQSAEELIAALSAFHSTAESLPRNDADHDRHTVRIDSRRDLLAAEDERRVNESQPNGHEVDAALQSAGRHLLAGSLEQADAAVAEAIRINVTPQVLAVKKRIVEATRARHQEEMAARANRAVGDAVSLFLEGKHAEAIATLEQHEPRHPLVTGALEKMRSELERARGRAAEEPPAVQLPQPATAAEFDAQAPATRTFRHAIAEPALEEPIPPPEASRAYRTGQALGFTVRWLVALGTAAIAVELTDSAIRYLGAVSLRPELAESTVAIFLFLR